MKGYESKGGAESFRSMRIPALGSEIGSHRRLLQRRNFETESSFGSDYDKTTRALEYIAEQTVEEEKRIHEMFDI